MPDNLRFTCLIVAGLLVLLSACSYTTTLSYEPVFKGTEPPVAKVAVRIADERPAGHGGDDATLVGRMRGELGDSAPLHEDSTASVVRVVREATVDALKQARVAVDDRSSRVLVVTLREFWMDGYVGYKVNIVVDVAVQDERGTTVWSDSLRGQGGGFVGFGPGNAGLRTPRVFQNALADYAMKATQRFVSDDFQRNVF